MDGPELFIDSRRPAIAQLAHAASMMAAESQPLFDARFGGRQATVDLAADRPLFLLSTPEANLEFGAQLVGTHHTGANTWSWGWRDDQGWNPWTVGASRHLLAVGEAVEDPDILLGSMPYQEGMDQICAAATQAVTGLYVRYELHQGDRRHVLLLINPTLFDLPEPTPTATAQALHRAATAPWFSDARAAVRGYGARREGVEWEEDELGIATLRMDRGTVRVGFDEADGIRSVEINDAGDWLPAPADDGVAATTATRGPVGSGFATPVPDAGPAASAPTYSGAQRPAPHEPAPHEPAPQEPAPTPREPAPREPAPAPGASMDAPTAAEPMTSAPTPSAEPARPTGPGVVDSRLFARREPRSEAPRPSEATAPEPPADPEARALAQRQAALQAEFVASHAGRSWRLSLDGPEPRVDYLNGAGHTTQSYAAHLLGVVRRRPLLWQWAWSVEELGQTGTQRSAALRELGEATGDPSLGLPESAYEPGLEEHFVQLYVSHHGPAPLLRGRLGNGLRFWAFLEER